MEIASHDAFYKGDFQVNVQFYQGKIDKIEYLKTNQNTLKTVELSEVEVNNFLKANYKGTWQVDPSGPKGWFTPGGQLFAFQSYRIVEEEPNRSYYRLLIMTGESVQRFTNQLAIQETAAQSGF
jgi:hypothetical protein